MSRINRQRVGIIGLPRSGTTWIGKVFDSHPTVFYQHEPDYSLRLPCVPYMANETHAEVWKPYIEKWLCSLDQQFDLRTVGKGPYFRKSYYNGIDKFGYLRTARLLISKCIAKATKLNLTTPLRDAKFSNSVTVWKSVEMLGRIGCLATVAPSNRFIQVIRHPCGFVSSVLHGEQNNRFTSQIPMSDDLGLIDHALRGDNPSSIDIKEIYRSSKVARLAWLWRLMNLYAMNSTAKNENCLICLYDEVANNPVEEFEKLFQFSNLTLDPQTRDFLSPAGKKSDTGYYSVFKQSSSVAGKWRTKLSSKEIQEVLAIADPVASRLDSMGFKLET